MYKRPARESKPEVEEEVNLLLMEEDGGIGAPVKKQHTKKQSERELAERAAAEISKVISKVDRKQRS